MKKLSVVLLTVSLLGSAAQAASPTIPAAVQAQLISCDAQLVQRAADAVLRAPDTLREPFALASPALEQRYAGHVDEAAFLFLAMQLRTGRQLLFERDWRPEALTLTERLNGPLLLSAIEADPARARTVVQRVIDWDRATPDPYRERALAVGGEVAAQLARIDDELAALPDRLREAPQRVERARAALAEAEQRSTQIRQIRCDPATVDAVDLAAAQQRIRSQAEQTVRRAPLVRQRAGGALKSAQSYSAQSRGGMLPVRMTFTVVPAKGSTFFAEVDVVAAVTPERKLGKLTTTLACITEHGTSDRPAGSRDVCRDDPAARRP